MYRRKIGKKIFRRTRKHKFYGINAKKRPSLITRKRVRRGGAGETVTIQGIRENNLNIILDDPSCNEFVLRANELANAADDEGDEYTFSEQAIKDIKDCSPILGEEINIVDLIKENVDHKKENRRIKYEDEQYKKQREAEEAERPAGDRIIQLPPIEDYVEDEKYEEKRAEKNRETTKSLKNIQTFKFFKELIGKGLNDDDVLLKLDMFLGKYMVLIEHSKKIYKTIFSILIECIKFNDKNGVFIEKISTENINNGDDDNVKIYTNIIKLLYSLAKRDTDASYSIPDFLKYYNSFFENDQEILGYTPLDNKPILPRYINVNKVLRILYGYYDIIISTLAQYTVVLNIYSVLFDHIPKVDITNMANDKFSPNSISMAPEASTPPEETIDTATLKISNDVLLKFLLTDFTLTTRRRPKIPVNKEILVKALTDLFGFQVSFRLKNEALDSQSKNLEKVFSLNQPLDGQLNILKSENGIDDKLLTCFKNITWVKNFLLGFDNIFCFNIKSTSITGLSTNISVREQIEIKIIVPNYQEIQKIIENGEFFKTPKLPQEIMDFIVKILKENTQTNRQCNETLAFKEFTKYSEDKLSNSYYLGIFCNMVIYACYMSTNKDSKKEGKAREEYWGEKGTDLMRIYMNNFIIEYVINELNNLSKIFLDRQYQIPPDTYIFYGLDILSSLQSCKNAKIILEQIKTNFNDIYKKKAIDILGTYKKKYDDNNTLIDQKTLPAINELERLLRPFNEYNTNLLTEKKLNILLCVGNDKCNVFEETIKPSSDPPPQMIELQQILSINENNLRINVAKVCDEILPKLIESMGVSKSKKQELIQTLDHVKSYLPNEQKEHLVDKSDTQRKKCEIKVAEIISIARNYKKNGNQLTSLPSDYYSQMDICANPENVFTHQKTNENEYKKRVARAYYGIKEILAVCDKDTQEKIENLPNIQKLKGVVEGGPPEASKQLRDLMLKQCKDDHTARLGFYNQTRELIKAGLSSDEINKKCDEDFDYVDTLSDTRRKECEMTVATIINKARKHKTNHAPIMLEDSELKMIDICANHKNVFEHQKINPKEFYKRIARSYYGIMEILAVCNPETKEKIENLPNFIELKKIVENVSNFKIREMIYKHCKDDHKGVLGFHNKTRDLIKAGLPSDQINNKCDHLKTSFDRLNKPYLEFQDDLKEAADAAAAEALKNTKLTRTQIDKINSSNKLKTAMAYVNILNNKELYRENPELLERANKFLNDDISSFVKAEALVFFGVKPPVYESTNPLVQEIIGERARLRKIKEAARNDDNSFLSNIMGSFDGGTSSTKARRKYSRKAKHQPKTKRKNKSKPKSKPKSKSRVKSKAKTIKKNKRARRKFYKKYTRKH
jgi:hypothetical protein